MHCKTAFIHGQRLANASSYLTYTLVHKHVDILIVIKFYIREIYINRSLDISYNLIEIVVQEIYEISRFNSLFIN